MEGGGTIWCNLSLKAYIGGLAKIEYGFPRFTTPILYYRVTYERYYEDDCKSTGSDHQSDQKRPHNYVIFIISFREVSSRRIGTDNIQKGLTLRC